MHFKSALFCCWLFISFSAGAQASDLDQKATMLKMLLSRADLLTTRHGKDIGDSIVAFNDEIAVRLQDILTKKESINRNFDSLLKHPFLGITHSPDKRLWIFSWYENTGGSFQSNISMIQYRTIKKMPKVYFGNSGFINGSSDDLFNTGGADFYAIYKLRSANSRSLYLCIGSGISCGTCVFNAAIVVELTNSGINFNYPAFNPPKNSLLTPFLSGNSSILVDARTDDILNFEFDQKSQTLTVIFLTDDKTPIQSKHQKKVERKFMFDGVSFTPAK